MNHKIIIGILLILFSCTTYDVEDFGPTPDWDSKVKKILAEEDYAEVIQYFYYLRSEGIELETEITDQALEGLATKMEKAHSEGDFESGLVCFNSLKNMNRIDPSQESMGFDFRLKELTSLEADFLRADLRYKIIKLIEDYGEQKKFNEPMQEFLSRDLYTQIPQVKKWLGLPESDSISRPGDLLKGTVTIWVNKGMKLEQGMGFPDRVIGSGFFIDSKGHILTNHHVIASEVDPEYEGYSRLYIKLPQSYGEKIPAKVIGYDPNLDIALIKAEIDTPMILESSFRRDYYPGDTIYALGSPGGLENTLTKGIISAVNRRFLPLGDAMQVDVPINPGNSGGPLVDEQGDLIGVVFAGIELFEGINFSIPYHWIASVLPELYSGGRVEHSWVGLGLHDGIEGTSIIYSMPGTPAYKSSLQVGDKLLAINGTQIQAISDAQQILLYQKPGTIIRMTYMREDEISETFIKLGIRPQHPMELALDKDSQVDLLRPFLGIDVEPTEGFMKYYLINKVYTGTIGDELGLSENDPIRIHSWHVDKKQGILSMALIMKKRKAGFIESAIQVSSHIDLDILL